MSDLFTASAYKETPSDQNEYVNVKDLLTVVKSKNKLVPETDFNLNDLKANPAYLERTQAQNTYYKEETAKIYEAPKVSLADIVENNQNEAQIMLAHLKNKSKEFIDNVLE